MRLPAFIKFKPQSLALETEKLEARKPQPVAKATRILTALQVAGDAGVPAWQLCRISNRYSTRISDLRKRGYNIVCVRKDGHIRFVLEGDK